MFGKKYGCSKCDFEFCSGWSHHVGGQFLVCRNCAEEYVLGGCENPFGVSGDETLRLFRLGSDEPIPNYEISVGKELAVDSETWDGVCYLSFEDFACPGCEQTYVIAQSFENDSECPKCHDGKIVVGNGRCIY